MHIHTIFSDQDSSVVPEQSPELVKRVGHADVIGVSDHFEHFADRAYDDYVERLRALGLLVGTEIDGSSAVDFATTLAFDYYIYHCRDNAEEYRGAERLLATGRPVIIAHPNALQTDLGRVPATCLIELNNRYVWRCNWADYYGPYRDRFRFVVSSDAHQPHWLSQCVARQVASELGIQEQLIGEFLSQRRTRGDEVS